MTARLEILWQDNHLLAINKPSGLLTVPGRQGGISLREILAREEGFQQKLLILHRLDRETSGVLLLAKTTDAQRNLSQQFESRSIQKEYIAFVQGQPEEESGLILAPIAEHPRIMGKMVINQKKGKPSQTKWKVVERLGSIALLRCRPLTGRQHQIRVHLKLIDHPLLVDPLYAGRDAFYLSQVKTNYRSNRTGTEKPLLGRLSLHAEALNFAHPETGTPMRIEAPLPKDFRATLNQLKKLFS